MIAGTLSFMARLRHTSGFTPPESPPVIPPGTPAPLLAIEANGEFGQWDGTPPADPAELINYVVTVAEPGYSSTGAVITRTEGFYVGLRVRQPYPNNASLSANRVALGFHVYTGATVNGGATTNNSTLTSPTPFFQWVDTGYVVCGNTYRPKAFAAHIRGIACVKYIFSDGTNTVEAIATTLACEVSPNSGKAVMFYDPGDVDISSLAEADITLRAIAYPKIGVAVYDTDNFTGLQDETTLFLRKNVACAAAPIIAYIDTVNGDDTTGIASTNDATARANPFKSYGSGTTGASNKAMTANLAYFPTSRLDGCIFRISPNTTGSVTWPSAGRRQVTVPPIFEKDPNTVGRQPIAFALGNPRCSDKGAAVPFQSARFRGFDITVNGNNALLISNAQTMFFIEDCSIDYSSATGTGALFGTGNSNAAILRDTTFTGVGNTGRLIGSNGRVVKFIGCNSTVQMTTTQMKTQMHGCHFIGGSYQSGSLSHQYILINTQIERSITTSGVTINPSSFLGTRGACLINVSAEDCSSVEHVFFRLAGDGFVGNANHILIWHVSIAGFDGNCRSNLLYNDTFGVNNLHRNASMIGYINQGRVISKTDTFALDGNAVGNWGVIFGVSSRGNFFGRAPTTVGIFEYAGRNSVNPGQNRAIINDPLWVDNKASVNDSGVPTAGGTNFTLQAGSPARGIVENSPVPWDQVGNARATSGFVAAGALV